MHKNTWRLYPTKLKLSIYWLAAILRAHETPLALFHIRVIQILSFRRLYALSTFRAISQSLQIPNTTSQHPISFSHPEYPSWISPIHSKRNANSLLVFGKFNFRYECLQQCVTPKKASKRFQKPSKMFPKVPKNVPKTIWFVFFGLFA